MKRLKWLLVCVVIVALAVVVTMLYKRELAPVVDLKDAKEGKIVLFGSYEQDNDLSNGKEPIEWIVLDVVMPYTDEERVNHRYALMISKKVLAAKAYHHRSGNVLWVDSSLRKWLNGSFYNEAFTEDEQERMSEGSWMTDWNKEMYGRSEERDVVWISPVWEGYVSEKISEKYSMAEPTEYAIDQGINTMEYDGKLYCEWWLGKSYEGHAAHVAFTGDEVSASYLMYEKFTNDAMGVRPWILVRITD